jgi:MFS family permease
MTEGRPSTSRGRGPLSRHALLSLYMPAAAISMGQGIAAPALPVFAKTFDVSFGTASLVSVLFAFGGFAATLPTGYLIDRLGRRPVVLGGPILTALTSFLTAFAAPTFEWLLLWRFLGGAASQGWELSRLAMIADSDNPRERGRLLKWMFQISATSALLAPSIGGLVAEVDIRIPFILYGLLTLVGVIPSLWLLRETDPARSTGTREPELAEGAKWKFVLGLLVRREMFAFLVAQFLANVARGVQMSGVMNLYVAYAYGAGPLTIGLLATATGVVTTPVGFLSGSVMDRWGRKKALVPGFALLFVALLLVGATALLGSSFSVFVAAYIFMNVVQSITGGGMQVMGADLAPTIARGRFIGVWRLIGRGGGVAGPAAFGSTAELWGYAAAFGVLGVSALGVALIIGLTIRETVGRDRPAPAPP